MLYIDYIETGIPEKIVDIEDLQEYLNLKNYQIKVFKKVHGLAEIRKEEGSLTELLSAPILRIFERSNISKQEIKYIIYCHTIQNIYPFPLNIFNEISEICNINNTVNFSLNQQNCASSLVGLEIADSLLRNAKVNDKVLLIMGEKVFNPIMQVIQNTTILGEASAAVILSNNSKKNIKFIKTYTKVLGRYAEGIGINQEKQKQFEKEYIPTLTALIKDMLNDQNLDLSKISLILPHNVNISSWRQLSKSLDIPIQKIYLKNVSKYGHCFCADPFLNLESVIEEGILKKGDYFLMVSVGLGATFAVSLFQF
ncbi:hypothetical protein LBYS11_00205 [Lysinibacillus sp. YS11]|uniref:ketoacyl-ACP synthase III family protein n=1 Tax=Lysinibacillus TaxID=400634 RepID=UPI0008241BE8|nr:MULTISPECIES: ketoacyl-ACP synthase III family protein [Lysinibacillus]AUS84877.1 hypothetical protein LBYS11_00205 [Lysinibacillus sp. YS11]MEC1304543.1 ketoacyl-ACP synthase III family protein [Lysinibacillus capsici]MED3876110.1 ketoacyl-ACP synthase III family protein [Lysinibacillus capsici]OCX60879.1 hypothetical protein BFM98_20165 [Lysinibacillus sp. AR18-8]WPK05533.1 ketoacyl-ACP synthase III family protein [Lysinibacillus capsici]